jgi:hypothetical protein
MIQRWGIKINQVIDERSNELQSDELIIKRYDESVKKLNRAMKNILVEREDVCETRVNWK